MGNPGAQIAAAEAASDCETGAVENAPVVGRTRGRPRGSKNKVSNDARQYLAEHGRVAFEVLVRIAAGRPVYTQPDASGRRTKRYPDLDLQFEAARVLADKLAPNLKMAEISSSSTVTSVTDQPSDAAVAAALLAVLTR